MNVSMKHSEDNSEWNGIVLRADSHNQTANITHSNRSSKRQNKIRFSDTRKIPILKLLYFFCTYFEVRNFTIIARKEGNNNSDAVRRGAIQISHYKTLHSLPQGRKYYEGSRWPKEVVYSKHVISCHCQGLEWGLVVCCLLYRGPKSL